MVNDDCLDDLIDVSLAGDLVLALRCRHECGAEAYGQVVRVHHVLIAVLGQTGGGQRQDSYKKLLRPKIATAEERNPD